MLSRTALGNLLKPKIFQKSISTGAAHTCKHQIGPNPVPCSSRQHKQSRSLHCFDVDCNTIETTNRADRLARRLSMQTARIQRASQVPDVTMALERQVPETTATEKLARTTDVKWQVTRTGHDRQADDEGRKDHLWNIGAVLSDQGATRRVDTAVDTAVGNTSIRGCTCPRVAPSTCHMQAGRSSRTPASHPSAMIPAQTRNPH